MNPAEFANIARAEEDFWWYRGMRRILFAVLDPIAKTLRPGRVGEGGCGTAHLSRVLSERYGWAMFPFDIELEGLSHARRYAVGRLTCADVIAPPFQDGAFDLLLLIDVLAHVNRGDEQRAFAEAFRAVRSGGMLIVRTAAFDSLRSRHSEFVLEKQRFTRDRLRQAATGAGFDVERITYINAALLPIAWFKFRVWEPLTRQKPGSGVRPVAPWLDRMLYAPLAWESRRIARGGGFGAGQSLLMIARKPE
jgi:SAM-dependent methyltransferase